MFCKCVPVCGCLFIIFTLFMHRNTVEFCISPLHPRALLNHLLSPGDGLRVPYDSPHLPQPAFPWLCEGLWQNNEEKWEGWHPPSSPTLEGTIFGHWEWRSRHLLGGKRSLPPWTSRPKDLITRGLDPAWASPENLLETQILGPHSRLNQKLRTAGFTNKPSRSYILL